MLSGFDMIEDLSPLDIRELYVQDRIDGFLATEHVHFVYACVQ